MNRIGLIHQVPINVVFDNELGRIEPGALSANGLRGPYAVFQVLESKC